MTNLCAFRAALVLLFILGRITSDAAVTIRVPSDSSICRLKSVKDSILGALDLTCPLNGTETLYYAGVFEGDEVSLQRALNMVHKRTHDYVALLFYASWCPFSGAFRPNFTTLASMFPSVPHFAIEESAVRPSILSKYGVHGFPTLFLLNSTMRVRYHGSRTLDSVASFYGDIAGIKKVLVDGKSPYKIRCSSGHQKHENNDQESCPFSWARSPENLLGQGTYLAMASAFVVLRLLYIVFLALQRMSHFEWRRFRGLWEHPVLFLYRTVQLFNSLKEPCKRRNLQEGALNARAWASKSLASVSLGDASSSRVVPVSEIH